MSEDAAPPAESGPPGEAIPPAGVPPPAAEPEPPACVACRRTMSAEALFCPRCGHRVGDPPPPRRESYTAVQSRIQRGWTELRGVITLYILLLATSIAGAVLIKAEAPLFDVLLGVDGTDAVIVAVAAVVHRKRIAGLFRGMGFGIKGYGAIAAASVPIFLLIYVFVTALTAVLPLEEDRLLKGFEGRSLVWPILVYCVTPPLIEELAFRGVIFGILRSQVRLADAFWISSMAFAVLHMSVFAFFSHTLLGLYLCWLRHRSGSLLPPMFAHALHNAWVLLDERLGLMP